MRGGLALLLVGCSSFQGCSIASPDDYDPTPVYAAIVAATLASASSSEGYVLVWPHTPSFMLAHAMSGGGPQRSRPVPNRMLRAHHWANLQPRELPSAVLNSPRVRSAGPVLVTNVNAEDFWMRYRALHVGALGILTFDAPGFSPDGTKAFLNYGLWCGELCGTSRTAFLEHVDGAWQIVDENINGLADGGVRHLTST